jgi:S-(hydroxymethyl)glutathione dehydrogenase/alcohol dehydrogenase
MPLDRAAVIGCAVTTGAGAIFNAPVTPGETVAVVGCGGVGLATINAAKIAGAGRIIAADPVPEKRALAIKLGATDIVDAIGRRCREADPRTHQGRRRPCDRGGRASRLGKPRGRVAAPRRHRDDPRHDAADRKVGLSAMDLLSGKKLQGAIMGGNRFPVDIPASSISTCAGCSTSTRSSPSAIPLERINDAFDKMKKGDAARSVIVFRPMTR